MAKLVIVESPAKAKTIGKYLGDDYEVTASMGHIRDLPASQLGIDVEHGYTPQYISIKGKEKLIKELKSKAKHADGVLLATDPDREGEAISWHLANILGLDPHEPNRVTFDEITKKGVKEGMAHPRAIDEDLFNAQQARRVLDRLVGYKLSPFLWRKVRRGLSAGRVQSVAVRLIDDREKEIENFKPDEYWNVDATLGAGHKSFVARLATDANGKKLLPKSEAEARAIEKGLEGASYVVSELKRGKRAKQPTPAFITSTLQQEASRRLGFTATRTMRAAQTLYEGVDIAGHGMMGLITYMRTDSLRISDEAVAAAKEYIAGAYGEAYICPYKRTWKTKSATAAQDAHEAIRPSVPSLTPDEKKLYDLIWKRTVASQMVCAELDRTTIVIDMSGSSQQFVATGEVVRFDGFLRLYSESTDDDQAAESGEGLLPKMAQGDELLSTQITATERFTQAPARYNEASLVKRLEELGIGRPSTYAPTITTIINRGYVVKQNREGQKRNYVQMTLTGDKLATKNLSESYGKEKNRLSPTDIGMVVNDYLETQFKPIMDYNFTASVEKEFDRIADGDITWVKMIHDFYGPFHQMVDTAIGTQTDKKSQARILGNDPKTGHIVKARIGRYGPMVEIEGEEGQKGRFASLKKGQLIESITLEEALALFALPRDLGQLDGEELSVGIGKYGPYVRHGKSFASLQKGDDPYTLTYERAVEIVHAQQAAAAAANTPLRSFPEEPDMLVKNGRYGAYIAYKGKNYRLPKGSKPEELTLDDCLKIVADSKK